jgi:hypothetical protein
MAEASSPGVGRVHPRTRSDGRDLLQGLWAIVISLAGTYAQVVNYVVAMDCIFFGLTAVCLFVFRRRKSEEAVRFRVPGHPWTTLLFIAAQWMIVVSTFAHDPERACIGLGIALAGLPAYFLWRRRDAAQDLIGPRMNDDRGLSGFLSNPASCVARTGLGRAPSDARATPPEDRGSSPVRESPTLGMIGANLTPPSNRKALALHGMGENPFQRASIATSLTNV